MKPGAQRKRWAWAAAAVLVLAVLLDFSGALSCGFVDYDDPAYVTSNDAVRHGLAWEGVRWAFATDAASNWHPLTWLSHMTDVSLYGLQPWGHHLTNLLLHAANAVLLFIVLSELTGAAGAAFVAAALFALHPLRVESVAWISERKDVLSTFFWMLAVWAWARHLRRPRDAAFYLLSLFCFALGLMAKPMLVTLPLILLLFDYWPLQRRAVRVTRLVLEKAPFFALALASSAVTFIVQRRGGAVSPLNALPVTARAANAVVSYARYLAKIFWPARLSVLYPYPGHWEIWKIAGASLLLLVITAAIVMRRKAQPYLMVGWFWFIGMLVPVIGLVQVGIQSMADRYSYLPSVGIFIMLVWGVRDVLRDERWARLLAAAALGTCCILTALQVRYWHDSETLFRHAVAVTKDNYLAYNNLGFFLSNEGKNAEAIEDYRKSVEINPNYDEAHNNLGFALAGQGDFHAATNEYIKALSLNPKLTEAHNNLGNALGNLGLTDAAIHEYQVALAENPRHAEAHNNYGVALAMHGQLDAAIEQFRDAVRAKPDYAGAHSDLGNALALKGDLSGAMGEYQTCLQITPNDPQVQNNLANVLVQLGRLADAITHYRLAIQLRAENPEAHFNLGLCLAREGKLAEAEEQYTVALRQRPDYDAARRQLDALVNARKSR